MTPDQINDIVVLAFLAFVVVGLAIADAIGKRGK